MFHILYALFVARFTIGFEPNNAFRMLYKLIKRKELALMTLAMTGLGVKTSQKFCSCIVLSKMLALILEQKAWI